MAFVKERTRQSGAVSFIAEMDRPGRHREAVDVPNVARGYATRGPDGGRQSARRLPG
jgi:hypothetical protein